MVRVVVRVLKPQKVRRGPVELTVYTVEREERIDGRDFLDVVAEYSERYRSDRESLVVISVVDDKGNVVEEAAIYNGDGMLLFPSPAVLEKIVVVRRVGDNLVREEYSVDRSYYVYMGDASFSDNVEAVVLVTDKGARPLSKGRG